MLSGALYLQGRVWTSGVAVDESGFSVKSSWVQNQSGGPQIWFVQNGVVTHVPTAIFVYFTNLKSTPVMIYSSWVEQKGVDGNWKSVGLPFGTDGDFFLGNDRKDVVQWKYPTFDSAVRSRSIGPNETVQGWLFCKTRPTGLLRFGVTDVTGKAATEVIDPIANGGGWPNQLPDKISTHIHSDISALPLTD